MGYTTYFNGSFNLDKTLSSEHKLYLNTFNNIRHMKRDIDKLQNLPDPVRENVGLPIGKDGEYYVGSTNDYGQDKTEDVINYNSPPAYQPDLWCKWVPSSDGNEIVWDEAEKFYGYTEWIEYLIEHFLQPWGYILNGEVNWEGEDHSDIGIIIVKDNVVTTKIGKIVYE